MAAAKNKKDARIPKPTTSNAVEDEAASESHIEVEEKPTCFQRIKDALSLVPKGVTPPDWGILWMVFISLFSSAFTLTFLFPFLPEMILTFGYDEKGKGTYVGLVASSVFAGRAVGSFFWGWLTDLKGRRLVLLCTIFGNGVFSFLFGFAHNLHMAMLLRFFSGLANGTVGTAKTILYDVSDNSNQAFSMSMISVAWGSGLILGPTLGGWLALPARKYPSVFSQNGVFGSHPFLLPSLMCLIVCTVVFLIVFFKFQEPAVLRNEQFDMELSISEDKPDTSGVTAGVTKVPVEASHLSNSTSSALHASNPLLDRLRSGSTQSKIKMSVENLHCESDIMYFYAQRESEKREEEKLLSHKHLLSKSMNNLPSRHSKLLEEELPTDLCRRSYSVGDQSRPNPVWSAHETSAATLSTRVQMLKKTHLPNNTMAVNISQSATEPAAKKASSHSCWCSPRKCWHAFKNSALLQLLRQKDVRHSVALYTVFSFAVIGYEDVFTIFAATAIEYDGLAFSTDEIGTALGAVSIPLMFIQIKLYPMLVKKCGIKRAFLVCMFFVFIPIQLVPILHLLVYQKVWLWVGIVCLTLPQRVGANSCFAGSSLLINNSVTSDMAGKANGIGMTATAVARTLAPTIGGAMFSWSLGACEKYGPPFDVNLTFVFFGFILFIASFQCLFLPEHLDHQKK